MENALIWYPHGNRCMIDLAQELKERKRVEDQSA
jgi:hypothetical protein